MKAKKQKAFYDGHYFDSSEEREFYYWCEEAQRAGFIHRFEYHPNSFNITERASVPVRKELKTKSTVVDKFLFHPHEYTPDFILYINPRFRTLNHGMIAMDNQTYYIDVKGGFSIYNNEREFSINQKLIYYFYSLFINKVIPKEFFQKTYCPARSARTGTGLPRKHFKDMPTIRHAMALNTVATPEIDFVDPETIQEPPDLFGSKTEFEFTF